MQKLASAMADDAGPSAVKRRLAKLRAGSFAQGYLRRSSSPTATRKGSNNQGLGREPAREWQCMRTSAPASCLERLSHAVCPNDNATPSKAGGAAARANSLSSIAGPAAAAEARQAREASRQGGSDGAQSKQPAYAQVSAVCTA
jgi:hypothetical protein